MVIILGLQTTGHSLDHLRINLVMAMSSRVHTRVHLNTLVLIRVIILNPHPVGMGLGGTNQVVKTREVAMITTANRHHRNNSKLMEPLVLQLMGRAMVTARLQPTVKDKAMAKMVTVVIMQVQHNLAMASHSRTQALDTTSSSKDTVLATAMPLIQHQMGTLLHTDHKVTLIKHLHLHLLHLDSRTMLVVNRAQILITLLASPVMGHPNLHRVAMVPNHPMEVTGHLRLKNRAVSQRIHSLSSHLVLKVGVMLSPAIHLPSPAMVKQIQVLRDLHHRLGMERLNQGTVPHLTEHQLLKLATANSSPHNTVAQLIVPDTLSLLRLTLLMQPLLNQPSLPGLPKHHPRVNESSRLLYCSAVMLVIGCSM